MGNCAMERKSQFQMNADIQCSNIKSLFWEAKQLFQQDDKIIVTPIMKISPNIYLKLENMQISGSFKYRGAYLYFHQVFSDKVIIASSGNFAKACDLAHQKIMKEREFIQSRHKLSNFIMGNSKHKEQELDTYKKIQKLEKQLTQSLSENDQLDTLMNDQNKTTSQNFQQEDEKNDENYDLRNSVEAYKNNKKVYQGQLSSDGQEFDSGHDNNFREQFSPNESFEFKVERNLSIAPLSPKLNYFETPTDNPDLEDNQSYPHKVYQKLSLGNLIQFNSKNQDMKNENNKQSNNPIQFNHGEQINQEYDTPTPLPDDLQQQIDLNGDQDNKEHINNPNLQAHDNGKIDSKKDDINGNTSGNAAGNNNLNGSKLNNHQNGNGNGHHIQDDAVQQLNDKQKEKEPLKESAKEFVKLKESAYTFTQSNHIKDSRQLGLQIEKTGSQLIIVVPETVKQEKIKDIKSQIVKYSTDCVECEVQARQYANQNHGYRYFSPYNDIYMVAGNATIGYELAEQLAEVSRQADYLFIAVGGGGLISGIAFYFKVIREQKIKIIGVQPEKNCAMYNIVYGKNKILEDTVCDATAGGVEFNAMTIQICKHMVDEWVLVKEQDILKGQKKLWNDHKIIVETSAAMAFVACENYQKISQKTYVALLCGGNVDVKF